ncbi:MAG: hypothetical protein ABFS37_12440, partial [Acidobacteriota bacterium]
MKPNPAGRWPVPEIDGKPSIREVQEHLSRGFCDPQEFLQECDPLEVTICIGTNRVAFASGLRDTNVLKNS